MKSVLQSSKPYQHQWSDMLQHSEKVCSLVVRFPEMHASHFRQVQVKSQVFWAESRVKSQVFWPESQVKSQVFRAKSRVKSQVFRFNFQVSRKSLGSTNQISHVALVMSDTFFNQK
jgi:hypothetical protein